MMTSHILKSADFPKTQKSRSLENKTLFFLQMKNFINCTSKASGGNLSSLQVDFHSKYRNINTQGITTGESSFIKLNGFY